MQWPCSLPQGTSEVNPVAQASRLFYNDEYSCFVSYTSRVKCLSLFPSVLSKWCRDKPVSKSQLFCEQHSSCTIQTVRGTRRNAFLPQTVIKRDFIGREDVLKYVMNICNGHKAISFLPEKNMPLQMLTVVQGGFKTCLVAASISYLILTRILGD